MDALHQIIKSLTQTEKRYFKVFASSFRTDSAMLKLFDVMDATEEYVAKNIKKKTGIKNLVETKSALRKLLFRAMRNYNEGVNIEQELRDNLSNINFLLRKELREEAAKEIRKAIKLAEKGEAYQYLSELLLYSATPFDKELKPHEIPGYFMGVKEHQQKVIGLWNQVQEAQLYQQYLAYYMLNTNYETATEALDKIASIGEEIEKLMPGVQSGFAKICMLITMAKAYAGKEKCIKIFEQTYSLYKDDPFNITKHPELYFKFISNYVTLIAGEAEAAKLSLQLFAELEKGFIDFENFFKYYPGFLDHCKIRLTGNKLLYCRMHKDWRDFDTLMEEVKEYTANKNLRKEAVTSLAVVALICALFEQKKYAQALDWIQFYYTLPSGKVLKPALFCVRFYEVICFFADKDYHLSEVKAKNLAKTIDTVEFKGDYYKLISTFLRRLNHWDPDNQRHKAEIAELKTAFEKLHKAEDDHYYIILAFLEPEKVLEHLFK